MPRPELLSPAGSIESLAAAIRFGADAVYFGGPIMQLRAESSGFDRDSVEKALQMCHRAGKKGYITVNSFARNGDIEKAGEYARFLYDAGADAAIVSDIGVLEEIKSAAPDLPVHISTQANCQNYAAATVYYNMGAERIILAREMSIEDIAELRAKTPEALQLEAFVHGAMCMSYSGRCFISSFLTGRSANRGDCAQPCRWKYYLCEEKREGEYFRVVEDDNGSQIMSSYDLCCIDILDKLESAGVSSFKIEGRMKSSYYTAVITRAYRAAIDGGCSDILLRELDTVSHRRYTHAFYDGDVSGAPCGNECYLKGAVFGGIVTEAYDDRVRVEQRSRFSVGDIFEAVSPGRFERRFKVEWIIDQEGKRIGNAPHPRQKVLINCPYELSEGDFLRIVE